MFDFDWLIQPYSKQDFFENTWQKNAIQLASKRPHHFERFFSAHDLERTLEYGQPKPPSIRLASTTANEKVTPPYNSTGRLDIDKLRKYYLSGQTVIVNNVEDFDANVAMLVQALQKEISCRAQVNAYLTPPSAQGFNPHYDTHDVIVMQIEGEKLWRVHDKDSVCPLNELTNGDPRLREATTEPTQIKLTAGDVLYMPRGWIHEAETTETASLHLTIGIHPPLGKDLLAAALECACRVHPQFREPLPVGFLGSPEAKPLLQQQFAELLHLFTETASVEQATGVIEDELVRRGRSGGDGHLFSDMNKLHAIATDSKVERRQDVPCRLVDTDKGIGLQFLGSVIEGPPAFEPAMRFVMQQTDAFKVGTLPDLEPDHQRALMASLITDGLCRFTETTW